VLFRSSSAAEAKYPAGDKSETISIKTRIKETGFLNALFMDFVMSLPLFPVAFYFKLHQPTSKNSLSMCILTEKRMNVYENTTSSL
jgi:hypothetical protein